MLPQAHWCGPCRGFTPELNAWVGTHAAAAECAVIFCTADRSAKAAHDYFSESMKNFSAALPFGCPALSELDSKYKVEGIPTLVVVDAKTGELITASGARWSWGALLLADTGVSELVTARAGIVVFAATLTPAPPSMHIAGREGVSEQPEGFPWRPRSPLDILRDAPSVVDSSGAVTPMADFLAPLVAADGRLALYFSVRKGSVWCVREGALGLSHSSRPPPHPPLKAHWCGPCQSFTPKAAAWYTSPPMAAARASSSFGMLFVSSDKTEREFDGYRAEMPWPALNFASRDVKKALSSVLDVEGIPTLVVLSSLREGGRVEFDDAVRKVMSAPEAFPWPPAPWTALDDAAINEFPTLVAFVDGDDAIAAVAATEVFKAAAAARFANGKPSDALRFALATSEDRLTDRVRAYLKLQGASAPQFAVVNVRRGGRFVLDAGAAPPSLEALEAWLAEFAAGTLTPFAGSGGDSE